MAELVIRIPGEPVPQNQGKIGRWKAKDGRQGATIRQPAKVRHFKVELQERMARAAIDAGMAPDAREPFFGEGPVALELLAVFACPVSQHRKREPVSRRPHIGRYGNCDNLTKPVGDAGEGILWHDDGQICMLHVEKLVAAQGESPYLEIRARRYGEIVERGGDATRISKTGPVLESDSVSNDAPVAAELPGREVQPILFEEES